MLLSAENTTVARRRPPRSVIWEKHQPFVAELKITISLSNSPPIAFLSSSSCAITKEEKEKKVRKGKESTSPTEIARVSKPMKPLITRDVCRNGAVKAPVLDTAPGSITSFVWGRDCAPPKGSGGGTKMSKLSQNSGQRILSKAL
ncbi:hypothetical protein CEXT_229991 [Caerostris extrusa]|uniref:Uncharacterized protein n=1 Tax=Caerostris extrusa TaxID=172846 RepID=A0AAV4UJK6_CAEEX|nr:hypothetical protein CEXT_229991 [Caerostris extrusa]